MKEVYYHKRVTIYALDNQAISSFIESDQRKIEDLFTKIAQFSNHDPLHSINGAPERFKDLDPHLRFGGVELAPTIFQALYINDFFKRKPEEYGKFCNDLSEYISVVSKTNEDSELTKRQVQAYFTAIMLRRLLLLFPANSEIIQGFLQSTENTFWKDQRIEIKPAKYIKFLNDHFSDGDHLDSYDLQHTAHTNRNRDIPYNHGKNSFITPWITDLFRQYFGQNLDQVFIGNTSTKILLDTLSSGCGFFAAISAFRETQAIDKQKILDLFKC